MNVGIEVPLGFGDISPLQVQYVNETLAANQTSRDKFTARFETALAKECGAKRAVFMGSGTDALILALKARKKQMGWKNGACVIVPATTFIASVSAVRIAGLKAVLCDVNPCDYNIDFNQAEKVARECGAVAIMTVHLLGRACDMDAAVDLSDRLGLDIIEDCCEAFGVEYKGSRVGSFGAAGAISTYVSHHISTGTGGAVVTNDEWIADKVLSLMQHGIGDQPYCFNDFGYSCRSTEMEAALGVGILEDEKEWGLRQAARKVMGEEIGHALRPHKNRIIIPEWPKGSVPMFFPVEVRDPADRKPLMAVYQAAGIKTRPMLPLVTQAPIRKMLRRQGKTPGDYPNALDLTRTAFLIGCHPGLGPAHTGWIRKVTEDFFNTRN